MKSTLSAVSLLAALILPHALHARSIVKAETFSMYSEAHHVVNPTCDYVTSMTIDYADRTVTLENFVRGVCEIAAFPDRRVYQLQDSMHNAHGVVYHGVRTIENGAVETINIIDHRTSPLRIRWAALLESTELRRTRMATIKLYSTP